MLLHISQIHSFLLLRTILLLTIWIYHILLIYSAIDRYLDCFQFGTITKKVDVNSRLCGLAILFSLKYS